MDFFHLTVTSGLTRGGVHPKFWVLFFLGGHCHWIFPTSVRRRVGLFVLTATWGLTRGGVHPKIWALFFLGGHCQELFFKPHIGFFPRV